MGVESLVNQGFRALLVSACLLACNGGEGDSKPEASAGSGPSGGSGGSASGGGGAPGATPSCDPMEGRVVMPGGRSLTIPFRSATNITSANANSTKWSWGEAIGMYGMFRMDGTNAVMGAMNQPADGATLPIDHAVLAPDVSETLGTMYGVAPGSGSVLRRENGQIVVDLKNVATLTSCGDFPAMGELNLCYNAGDDCPASFDRGTLDGYSWNDDITSLPSTGDDLRYSVGSQGAQLRGRLEANGTTFKWTYFSTSIYSRYEGKVLCAGSAELGTMTIDAKTYTVIQLRNLGWLEGPGSGAITGCLR